MAISLGTGLSLNKSAFSSTSNDSTNSSAPPPVTGGYGTRIEPSVTGGYGVGSATKPALSINPLALSKGVSYIRPITPTVIVNRPASIPTTIVAPKPPVMAPETTPIPTVQETVMPQTYLPIDQTGWPTQMQPTSPGSTTDVPVPENGQNYFDPSLMIQPGTTEVSYQTAPIVERKDNTTLIVGLAAAIGALMLLK